MSFRKRVFIYAIIAGISLLFAFIVTPAAHAQVGVAAQKQVTVEKVPIRKLLNDQYEITYTDYKGCIVIVEDVRIVVEADSASKRETAYVVTKAHEGFKPGQFYFDFSSGTFVDRTRQLDLINRQCASMMKSIPDITIRKFVAKLLVE